jgi:DNA-binding transcriptional LysR family regulator
MDTKHLSLLVETTRTGSFAATARAHDLDPSQVSRAIAALEAELGCALFRRSTRRLALTEAGAAFLRRVAPLLEELDDAAAEARDLTAEPSGTLRLTVSSAYAQERLIPHLADFRTCHPGISIDLHISDDNLDLIAERIDLALRLAPAPSGDIICSRLHSTRYIVCAAPSYLERAGRPKTPTDLASHDTVRLDLPDFRSLWQFRGPDGEGSVAVNGSLLVSTPLAQRDLMLAGHGVALVADWIVERALSEGRCIDLFPDTRFAATSFDTAAWLLYPSRRFLPAKTRLMIDFLREKLGAD